MKHYIIVASKDHVSKGEEEGFAQSEQGKKDHLEKLKKNDWLIYYSSKDEYSNGKAYQKFTALGQVVDDEPYQTIINPDFKPWRRNIKYYHSTDVEIEPLINELDFISNKENWGLHLMSGFIEIGKHDFDIIVSGMNLENSFNSTLI